MKHKQTATTMSRVHLMLKQVAHTVTTVLRACLQTNIGIRTTYNKYWGKEGGPITACHDQHTTYLPAKHNECT